MEFQRVSERLKIEIVQRNHSIQTFNSYNASLRLFCGYFKDKKDSEHINSDEIKQFLAWVNEARGVCQERACFWAVRFWYMEIEKQYHKFDHIKPPKGQRKIQIPPTHEYIMQKIEGIKCPHQKAIVATFYTTGIRLMELCKIERANINRENLTMLLRRCKGGKDHIKVFPEALIPILESHWNHLKTYQHKSKYLFPGEKPDHYISDTTVYRAVKDNLNIHPHLLRHAFITYLHEQGVSIEAIRDMVDHSSITTTQIYTHTSVGFKKRLPNPFDEIKKIPENVYSLKRVV